MLATQCSKPAAMKADTGNTSATTLSVTDRPHTQAIPPSKRAGYTVHPKNNVIASGWILATALFNIDRPTRPPSFRDDAKGRTRRRARRRHQVTQIDDDPVAQHFLLSTHLRSPRPSRSLFPVKSSAPATRTIAGPSEKASPPITRAAAKLSSASMTMTCNKRPSPTLPLRSPLASVTPARQVRFLDPDFLNGLLDLGRACRHSNRRGWCGGDARSAISCLPCLIHRPRT